MKQGGMCKFDFESSLVFTRTQTLEPRPGFSVSSAAKRISALYFNAQILSFAQHIRVFLNTHINGSKNFRWSKRVTRRALDDWTMDVSFYSSRFTVHVFSRSSDSRSMNFTYIVQRTIIQRVFHSILLSQRRGPR